MATAHHKKRKSSQEKHDELEGVKKKKKSSRDGGRGRRTKSGSRSSHSKAPAKVHSVSELVKLSGEIKVPKCLGHYAEDRTQLLDQVFTILPESEVKGMLPDILKGLRLKHVKQLCLEQLKKMSTEEVMDIIEPREQSQVLNLDAAVFELMGEQELSGDTSRAGGGNVEQGMERDTGGGEEGKGDGGRGGRGGGGGGGGGEEVEAREQREGQRDGERGCLGEEAPEAGTSHLSERSPPLTEQSTKRVKRDASYVSGDEDMETSVKTKHSRPPKRLDPSRPETMECDTTTEESVAVQVLGEREREEEEEAEVQEASNDDEAQDSHSDTDSTCSLEDYWLCDFPKELPELARLQEIEFRRRALEAELRRDSQLEQSGVESTEMIEGEEEEEVRPEVVESNPAPSVKVDKMEALELQMRQRALQSLLAKKKHHHL